VHTQTLSQSQRKFMRRALQLARRGEGYVEPNPMVGCVIVKAGRIVGEGYHRRFGGPHAEVQALKQAGKTSKSATAYVTLEPCNFTGKTPPCTEALIKARVKQVITALHDPNPLVSGKGVLQLRRAGIDVNVGLLEKEARSLVAPFTKKIELGLPYVIAKWAQSIDGKIATRQNGSKWISGQKSRRLAHRLRARMDAIIVGSSTILLDDPQLTAREVTIKRVATRVVLDTRLRTPLKARIIGSARKIPTIIFTSHDQKNSPKAQKMSTAGVKVRAVGLRRGHVSMKAILVKLSKLGMTNVMIEGGGRVLGSALDDELVDEVFAFVAPIIIGGKEAPAPLMGQGAATMKKALRTRDLTTRRLGSDQLFHFYT